MVPEQEVAAESVAGSGSAAVAEAIGIAII